jgi:YHS domain-containing protein
MTKRASQTVVGLVALLGLTMTGMVAAPAQAFADKAPIYQNFGSNVAVDGYDPVAYFTAGAPTRGDARFTTTWRGATWRFASAANRDAFVANPARYAPQYGGYCAWAVAQGYTAKGDPRYWRIVGGKLYLNYNAEIQGRWNANINGFIAQGNANWPTVLSK